MTTSFPAAVGFELLKGARQFCKLHAGQPGARLELLPATSGADGAWLELPVLAASANEPYVLVPFATALDVREREREREGEREGERDSARATRRRARGAARAATTARSC